MIQDFLDSLPKPDPKLKEQTIRESVRLFREQASTAEHSSAWSGFVAQWKPFAAGAFVAAAALLIFIFHEGTRLAVPGAGTNAQELALLGEMKQVFGDKLEGVVQDGARIEPVVATGTSFTDSQPVIITLHQGAKEIRIVSFSGNTITLTVGNQKLSLTPIATGDGKVIVEGKDFIWSRGKITGAVPVSIDAKPLGAAL